MVYLEVACIIISFLTVYFTTPWFIHYLKSIGLIVKDQNKKKKPLVPISGGIIVLIGFLVSIFLYIFFRLFVFKAGFNLISLSLLFAGIVSMLIITIIGFLDDLVIKADKSESRGFKQWQKPLLTLLAAIPLMAISAGDTTMVLPFIGLVDFGLIYTLIFIPIGVVGAANMVNMLAGFNGLETGMGIVYTGMLGIYALIYGTGIAALISLFICASLIGFYFYNKVPAKILPGDSLTYLLGGTIVVVAILGNIEKAALIATIPFFVEFFLKLKGKFNKNSYGYEKNGKIFNLYDKKVYSLPHLFSRTGKFTERQIVLCFILIEFIFCLLMWVI